MESGWARTKLRACEAVCDVCGRAVWDGLDQDRAIGWLAPCGRRVARLEDCGTVDCIEMLEAKASETAGKPPNA